MGGGKKQTSLVGGESIDGSNVSLAQNPPTLSRVRFGESCVTKDGIAPA